MDQHESLGTGFNDMIDVPKNELFRKRHFPDVGRDIFDPVFVFVHKCLSGAAPGFFYSSLIRVDRITDHGGWTYPGID